MPGKKGKNFVARHQAKRFGAGGSNPMGARPSSMTWSTLSQATPATTRVQNNDHQSYRFCQTMDFGSVLTSSAGGATFYGTAFVLAGLPQATSIQAIFDQYRIDEVEIWITPTLSAGTTEANRMYSVIDYDTSTTPTSLVQLLQYQNCIETNETCGHYRRWKPRVGMGVGVANTTVQGMGNIASPWIDCLTPTVNHNGLLIGMAASATTCVLNLRVRLTVSVRNVI